MFFTGAYSQLKYEKESRLKLADVPPVALRLIDSLEIPVKIKWYSEESLTGSTVEAKFRFNQKKYSVEFSKEGDLQDIEITIESKEIQENIKETIYKNLESEFNKYAIKKIQVHYPGNNPEILSIIMNPQNETGNDLKYELIVNGKSGKTTKQYEMIFDNKGVLTGTKEIIQKNADYLVF
jgi:hypothetical protein